ncbi:MAG: hypothetical protein D6690_07245 [Nitrospirae bacterium]|nr:MAG: hypothetical protein D6690_07245 [Nitrospirota bacterium]
MPRTVQPVKGVTQVGTSSEALAQCEAEVPASSFQEHLDRLNQSTKTFGNVGNKAGSASDALTGSESDTGARVGKDIGEVAGFFTAAVAIAKEEQAREKALNACLQERGFELG